MPIGVPKVAFQGPEDQEPDCNRLYFHRFLFLCEELDDEKALQLSSLLVYFTEKDPTLQFFFFINSPGGGLNAGLGVYDLMQTLGPDVYTIGMGLAASMASLLLAGGTITKRVAYPFTRVMIHEPQASKFAADLAWCDSESVELTHLRERVIEIYEKHTGQCGWRIEYDLERDVFMTAEEALSYGIVDHIAQYRRSRSKKYNTLICINAQLVEVEPDLEADLEADLPEDLREDLREDL
uniref:ATP-dependent Clp protease proteolytic subunit n=1 Tax=Incarvillea younghusbandii TaxID=291325 RepID=A0A8A4VMK2_9LAMI|nr:ATP-dependent Clp protease proteolytic subunit [Incarvillea younghusbandii]